MMKRGLFRCAAWYVVALIALPAAAHHSFTGVFDLSKPIILKGTVVKFEFVNPHGWVTLQVPGASGNSAQWRVEVPNPNMLLRLGWRKDSLKAGDQITVTGFAARSAVNTALGDDFTFPDGRKVLTGTGSLARRAQQQQPAGDTAEGATAAAQRP
jgi:hypothetical protein